MSIGENMVDLSLSLSGVGIIGESETAIPTCSALALRTVAGMMHASGVTAEAGAKLGIQLHATHKDGGQVVSDEYYDRFANRFRDLAAHTFAPIERAGKKRGSFKVALL